MSSSSRPIFDDSSNHHIYEDLKNDEKFQRAYNDLTNDSEIDGLSVIIKNQDWLIYRSSKQEKISAVQWNKQFDYENGTKKSFQNIIQKIETYNRKQKILKIPGDGEFLLQAWETFSDEEIHPSPSNLNAAVKLAQKEVHNEVALLKKLHSLHPQKKCPGLQKKTKTHFTRK